MGGNLLSDVHFFHLVYLADGNRNGISFYLANILTALKRVLRMALEELHNWVLRVLLRAADATTSLLRCVKIGERFDDGCSEHYLFRFFAFSLTCVWIDKWRVQLLQ